MSGTLEEEEVGSHDDYQGIQEVAEAASHSYQESLVEEGAGEEVSHARRESPWEAEVEELHGHRRETLREEVEGVGKMESRKEGLLAVDAGSWEVVGEEMVQRHRRLEVHREGGYLEA